MVMIASAFAASADPFTDDVLKSDFYGPIEHGMKSHAAVPAKSDCCAKIKTWGDIGLFAGRFDLTENEHNGFPIYKAAAGELKLFYNQFLNRWTVSDEVNDKVLLRAIGQPTSCPDASDWLVWDGSFFASPDLTEPWAPYVKSEQMLECKPTDFTTASLKRQIGDKLCSFLRAESGVNSGRFCREGEKIAQMIFADWESTSNNFLNENLSMVLAKVHTLDQWHSVVNSILVKRTFETQQDVVDQIRGYIKMIINDIRGNYKGAGFAEEDSRFLYLKA